MMSEDLGKAYLDWCRFRLLNHYWPRAQRCFGVLSHDDIWWREHEANNSVGNLLHHENEDRRGPEVVAPLDWHVT